MERHKEEGNVLKNLTCYTDGVTCSVCFDELYAEAQLTSQTSTISALSCLEARGEEASLNSASQWRNT